MSINLEKEAAKNLRDEDKEKARLARVLIEASRAWRQSYGELMPQTPEAKPLTDLEAVVAKQVDRLIELKFHEAVGITEEEYRSSFTLPEGARKPREYEGRFDIPLVVDPRVSLFVQHSLSRPQIREFINTDSITNITPVPDKPYLMWTHNGKKYGPLSVEQAIGRFADDEVGSPQIEVTALFLQRPEFFRNWGIDAAGSRFEDAYAPYLDTFRGRPRVLALLIALDDPYWRALSRGKEIIEFGS